MHSMSNCLKDIHETWLAREDVGDLEEVWSREAEKALRPCRQMPLRCDDDDPLGIWHSTSQAGRRCLSLHCTWGGPKESNFGSVPWELALLTAACYFAALRALRPWGQSRLWA